MHQSTITEQEIAVVDHFFIAKDINERCNMSVKIIAFVWPAKVFVTGIVLTRVDQAPCKIYSAI